MNTPKKILVFDDNEDILELFIFIFEESNYQTKTSYTTKSIEEQVFNYMPDLIFMDNWLPGMTGIEATRALKNNPDLKHIPVVFFSANNNISVLAQEAGADGYLAKPFDINTLEDLVKKYLG